MGNLADELDQLDDDEEEAYQEEETAEPVLDAQNDEAEQEALDGARDSGIDVSYSSRKGSPGIKNFSKPFSIREKPPDKEREESEDKLSPELEDAMNNIARMTSYSATSEDPLIPRTVALLRDLGNQSGLEVAAQRLTTSTNSLANFVGAQSKSLQALSTSLYSPLGFGAVLDIEIVEETIPLVDLILKNLPIPDPAPLQGLQKLDRESTSLLQTASQLRDTLQMGKQITNSAARHLRTTVTMVEDLRRERERADLARHELAKSDVETQLRERRCAAECKDVLAGFDEFCDALRASLVSDVSESASMADA